MPPAPPRPVRNQRFALLGAIVLLGFGLVVAGLLRLQVLQHDELQKLADQNRIRLDVIRAPRGAIRDRLGRLLADNQPSFDVVFRPVPAESLSRARAVIESGWLARVSALVEKDTLEVYRLVRDANASGQSALLRRAVPYSVLAAVEEMRSDLPGIDVQVAPIRHYPEGAMAAQLLGYAGQINDRELEQRIDKGYKLGDLIGKTGLERRYEEVLRGVDGAEFVVVNAHGRRVSTLKGEPPRLPVPGHDLTLSVDLDAQRALEAAMSGVARGAAVVVDPRTGGVLAMVSRPGFDPNEFSRGISTARWKELNVDGAYPLLNRAIQSAYPPGSTFKVAMSLAGMHYGLTEGGTHMPVSCGGGYQYGGRYFRCWQHRGHGSLDLIHALAQSCDTYYYQLGLKLGLEKLQAMGRAMGLGEKTGIDLPAEARGLLPDNAYYDKRFGTDKWPRGVLLNLGIGQGEILATPLQLALMTSIAANGGRPVRPHVVEKVANDPKFRVDAPVEPGVTDTPEHWATLREAMQRVIDAGTAAGARLPGVAVGGKTGTAQNPHGNDHALFVCFAPVDTPRIAMAIVAENSGHGGTICAPIAAKVMRRMLLNDTTTIAVQVNPARRAALADTAVIGD